jgi:hypothetical protein
MEEAEINELNVHVAKEPELSPQQLKGSFDFLIKALVEFERPEDKQNEFRPHEDFAEIFSQVVDLEWRLNTARALYAKAIETNEAASDHLLRTTDLIKAVSTVQQLLNRCYYGSCELMYGIHNDDDLWESLKDAEQELLKEMSEA